MNNKKYLGIGIGILIDNVAMGISMMVGVGWAIGAGLIQMHKSEEGKNE